MESILGAVSYTLGVIVGLILSAIVMAVPVWLLWPHSGEVLGLPALSYGQSVALMIVSTVIFKSPNHVTPEKLS